METSRFERVLNKLEMTTSRITDKISKDMKNVKPFDKEVKTSKDKIYEYLDMPPEKKEFARQEMPEYWGPYEQEIMKLMKRNHVEGDYG